MYKNPSDQTAAAINSAKSNFIKNVSNLLNNHLKHRKFSSNSKIKLKLKHLESLLKSASGGNNNNAADATNEKTIVSFLSNLLNDMEMEKDSEQHRTVGIFVGKMRTQFDQRGSYTKLPCRS